MPVRRWISKGFVFGAALLTLGGCPEEGEDLQHGFVKLELRPGAAQATDPFVGTQRIVATLQYNECLEAFYDANPNFQDDGIDGGPVFGGKELEGEGWSDRLCDGSEAGEANCDVLLIDQRFMIAPLLNVEYAINDPDLEGRILKFGPIPEAELAGCEGVQQPIVLVVSNPIQGFDGAGAQIWSADTFDPNQAATGQGQAIKFGCARTGT